MSKSFLIATLLLVSFMAESHIFGYALIDLNPGSNAPALVSAQENTEEIEAVELTSKQRGHLLALVPVNFQIKIRAEADGELSVSYPWYSFMTLTSREELETRLKVAIMNAKRSASVGSVKAAGAPEEPKFTPAEAKAVREAILEVLTEEGEE
jgi:hypothetical protein